MFENIDFSQLDSSSFKEDSVREEIITPILHKLGYSATGSNKIVRSKPLQHPYVTLGATSKKLNIFPDYLLQVDGVNRFVLDAKAPGQEITIGKNVHQVYSYASHIEVRAKLFGLCNGRQLTIFSIEEPKILLTVDIRSIDKQWRDLVRLISPLAFTHPQVFSFQPDFGLHLSMLGFDAVNEIFFPGFWINDIAMLETGKYMIFSSFPVDGLVFCASFDFTSDLYSSFLDILPEDKREAVHHHLNKYPFRISFESKEQSANISLKAHLNTTVAFGKKEVFMPFNIAQFIKRPSC